MPNKPVSSYVIICQQSMQEKDDVFSAIRMVDILFVNPIPDVPLEKQALKVAVIAIVKGHPGDSSKHHLRLDLIRPDGAVTQIGEAKDVSFQSEKYPDAPGGYSIVGDIGIVPKQLGTHYFALTLDGEEVARSPVTLREGAPEQSH